MSFSFIRRALIFSAGENLADFSGSNIVKVDALKLNRVILAPESVRLPEGQQPLPHFPFITTVGDTYSSVQPLARELSSEPHDIRPLPLGSGSEAGSSEAEASSHSIAKGHEGGPRAVAGTPKESEDNGAGVWVWLTKDDPNFKQCETTARTRRDEVKRTMRNEEHVSPGVMTAEERVTSYLLLRNKC